MAETTIEWTATRLPDGTVLPGYTFNAWEGCEKVSPGCANCYAASRDKRLHGGDHWGPGSTRLMHSEAYWRRPLTWNRQAEASGIRRKVFCASLSDVFEDRPELQAPRERLFNLIYETRSLDWLVLTKRPDRMAEFLLGTGGAETGSRDAGYFHDVWPNLWVGTTVEDQQRADERIPHLLRIPAAVRFLSCEPLLGSVDLTASGALGCTCKEEERCSGECRFYRHAVGLRRIDWVIAGGESGPGARPMHPDWARSLRDQCAAAHVPYLFKQWGEWEDMGHAHALAADRGRTGTRVVNLAGGHGFHGVEPRLMRRVGKAAAGRLLDRVEHNGFPEARQ